MPQVLVVSVQLLLAPSFQYQSKSADVFGKSVSPKLMWKVPRQGSELRTFIHFGLFLVGRMLFSNYSLPQFNKHYQNIDDATAYIYTATYIFGHSELKVYVVSETNFYTTFVLD